MSQKTSVNDLMYAGLFAALTAVLGLVSIPLPFSPVPITGQSLAVMLAWLVCAGIAGSHCLRRKTLDRR